MKRISSAGAVLLLISTALIALANGSGPAVDWWVIAGGGAASSGGNVTLDDTLGQPVIGPASGGSAALTAGYWAACTAAAAVTPAVTATRSGADVVLTWPAKPANVQHQVWVSTNPYFDPDSVTPTVVTANTVYTDTSAAASLVNHFYIVRGLNACSAASPNSGRKGEFTAALTPGS